MPADSDLADLLKKNPNEYALALRTHFRSDSPGLGLFREPLTIFSIALFVGTALNLLYRRRNFAQAGNWVLTIMMVFVLFAVHQGLVMFSPILSSKKLADAIEQEYPAGGCASGQWNIRGRLHIKLLYTPADPHCELAR